VKNVNPRSSSAFSNTSRTDGTPSGVLVASAKAFGS
jgi:hypothetical protein